MFVVTEYQSENTIVQFTYGDDNLNPEKMENNDRPIDFDRLLVNTFQFCPYNDDEPLSGNDLMELVEETLSKPDFQKVLPTGVFLHNEIRDFFTAMVNKEKEVLMDVDEFTSKQMIFQRTANSCRLTQRQADHFLSEVLTLYDRSSIPPGKIHTSLDDLLVIFHYSY